jgi:hypothetical protein
VANNVLVLTDCQSGVGLSGLNVLTTTQRHLFHFSLRSRCTAMPACGARRVLHERHVALLPLSCTLRSRLPTNKSLTLTWFSTNEGNFEGGNKGSEIMIKPLVLAAGAAVVFGSFVTASDADARHRRGFYGYYGHGRVCIPRRSYENPKYAPDSPPPCSYDNPGLPDFQLGSRG